MIFPTWFLPHSEKNLENKFPCCNSFKYAPFINWLMSSSLFLSKLSMAVHYLKKRQGKKEKRKKNIMFSQTIFHPNPFFVSFLNFSKLLFRVYSWFSVTGYPREIVLNNEYTKLPSVMQIFCNTYELSCFNKEMTGQKVTPLRLYKCSLFHFCHVYRSECFQYWY